MTAAAPWSVKGINPRAREVAKDLARRSGMTLGEWLNRIILEDDVPEEVTSEVELSRRPFESPRLRMASPPVGPAAAPVVDDFSRDDLGRVAQALDRLTGRIEASETRTGLAIAGVEHSVRQAMARLDTAERTHLAVSERLEEAGERLHRVESEIVGPRSLEAVRAVYRHEPPPSGGAAAEGFAARLVDRLAAAEQRTAEALGSLRGSLAALDDRLKMLEGEGRPEIERRLEALGAELSHRVEQARAEAVARLQSANVGGFEERLAQMAEQVSAAERRSAAAIERMGREVLAMADALNRRLGGVERQSAQALDQVGEIVRIGGLSQASFAQVEQAQAEALEKLGAEIGRVTERLSESLIQSERRAAQAINDVGEQVARVTERMEHRHERLAHDLAERIREGEERMTRLLESREGLPPRAGLISDLADEADDPPPVHAFGPALLARAEPATPVAGEPKAFVSDEPLTADSFAPIAEAADDDVFLGEVSAAESDGGLSTREVIDNARLAARAAASKSESKRRQARRPGERGVFGALSFRASARAPSNWQTALMLAGGAAFLSVGAAGVVLMERPAGATTELAAEASASPARAAIALSPQVLTPSASEAPAAAASDLAADYAAAIRDTESRQPGGLARLKAIAEDGYAPAQSYLGKLYETGQYGVSKNAVEARRWIERAAEGGDASAMQSLALYYFQGDGGPQDFAAAAGLFRKAAERGLVDSQYNLGLIYQSGSGVERDLAEAYKWFSIAAANGDDQASVNAADLQGQLTPAALAAGDQAVAAFKPLTDGLAQTAAPPAPAVAAAQRILGRLGYYTGPVNGASSRDLKLALLAYQRDQGLATTGALDAKTIAKLAAFAR